MRKYEFSWENTIGVGLDEARPSLGPRFKREVFHLFQYALKETLVRLFSQKKTFLLVRETGVLAGEHFFKRYCRGVASIHYLSHRVESTLATLGMWPSMLIDFDRGKKHFTYSVKKYALFSKMPEMSVYVTVFYEGFWAGIIKTLTGIKPVACQCDPLVDDGSDRKIDSSVRIEAYRLLQFTMRDILEANYGTEKADNVFREAGFLAGECFYNDYCAETASLSELINLLMNELATLGIGVLRMEDIDVERGVFTMTVNEDLDCSGMEDSSDVICVYDEGFLQGVLESFTGKKFSVREVDCWCTGGRICRFEAVCLDAL